MTDPIDPSQYGRRFNRVPDAETIAAVFEAPHYSTAAPVGTLEFIPAVAAAAPRRPRGALFALLVIAVLVAGVTAFALVRATRPTSGKPAAPAAAASQAAPAVPVPLPTLKPGHSSVTKPGNSAKAAVTFKSVRGHFSARFPAKPVVQVGTAQSAGQQMTTVQAVDAADQTYVEAILMPATLTAAQEQQLMHAEATYFAQQSVSLRQTSVHGKPALIGSIDDPEGQGYTMLIVASSGSRLYVLVAAGGARFTALRNSFLALP